MQSYKKTIFDLQNRIKRLNFEKEVLESENYELRDNLEIIKIKAAKGELTDIFGADGDQNADPDDLCKYIHIITPCSIELPSLTCFGK